MPCDTRATGPLYQYILRKWAITFAEFSGWSPIMGIATIGGGMICSLRMAVRIFQALEMLEMRCGLDSHRRERTETHQYLDPRGSINHVVPAWNAWVAWQLDVERKVVAWP